MAEIVAFKYPSNRPKRAVDVDTRVNGQVLFFTGVRYERWNKAAEMPKAPVQPPLMKKLRSKA